MTYKVKELFLTLQGEGAQSGRAAIFCRFSGCNLWSGREIDRNKAQCRFCDTDFIGTDGEGGGTFTAPEDLARAAEKLWKGGLSDRLVVFTGGEPLLQLDTDVIHSFRARGFSIAVETNGTQAAPEGIDWLCVSPKAGTHLVQTVGHELKLVYPQDGIDPEIYVKLGFECFSLQPCKDELYEENCRLAIAYCLQNPLWRLSLQTHKYLGIP